MTGVPQAIASIITRPNGSGQSIGTSSAIAPLRNADFSLVVDLADIFDIAPTSIIGWICSSKYSRSTLSTLAAILSGMPQCSRDADGAIDALFRRDAAEKREIRRLDRLAASASLSGKP